MNTQEPIRTAQALFAGNKEIVVDEHAAESQQIRRGEFPGGLENPPPAQDAEGSQG